MAEEASVPSGPHAEAARDGSEGEQSLRADEPPTLAQEGSCSVKNLTVQRASVRQGRRGSANQCRATPGSDNTLRGKQTPWEP
jgi:hypothetical protein